MSGAHQVTWWGGLDPYTFGVWVSQDKVFDLPDTHKAGFLFLRSLVAPHHDDHRHYIAGLTTDDDRFLAYTAFTVYHHEWRHWYDFTSTPFGMYRIGQLAAFFATLAGAYEAVANMPVVYSPLIRWLRSPAVVNAVHPTLGELPPDVANVLGRALEILRKADKDLRAATAVDGQTISTAQILESLAMLNQEQAIEDAFGREAAGLVRRHILRAPGGASFYAPLELAERISGLEGRAAQARALEASLFVNYGVFGSNAPLSPPEVFRELFGRLAAAPRSDVMRVLDDFSVLSFTRMKAFELSYAVMSRTMEQILSASTQIPDPSSHAARMFNTLGTALPSAFLMGGVARFRGELEAFQHGPSSYPNASAFGFHAPLLVEANPGFVTPDALGFPIQTLAGVQFKSWDSFIAFAQQTNLKSSNSLGGERMPGPYTQHTVWMPRMEDVNKAPPYYGILNVFHDLMYWRGLLFGPQSMAPVTYQLTTERMAQELGQTILN